MNLADAILTGTVDDVRRVLASTDDVNFIDQYGFPPLTETAIANDVEKGKLLLAAGADINAEDPAGGTALQWAVENDNQVFCELLLQHKADPNFENIASQSPLVKAVMRQNRPLIRLLCRHGGNLPFAQDFIYAKLLGHLFELGGTVDIVNAKGQFTEVDFEGFILEFTLDLFLRSLINYRFNYAARRARKHFKPLERIINAVMAATRLVKFIHYQIDYTQHLETIHSILNKDTVIIPISQEGHAMALIKHKNLLAICDRARSETYEHKPVTIYYMNRPTNLTPDLLCDLIYKRQPIEVFHTVLPKQLGLVPLTHLPVDFQKVGNCTWANLEACLPALYTMLQVSQPQKYDREGAEYLSMTLFDHWREWEQERTLKYFMRKFKPASRARKASIAAILAAIVFQTCKIDDEKTRQRAMDLMPILYDKTYHYTLDNYLEVYHRNYKTPEGENLQQLMDYYERIYR